MNPFPTMSELLNGSFKLMIPHGVILLFFGLNLLSFSFIGLSNYEYPFFIAAMYYWSIYRPTLLPYWWVLILGLLVDLVSGVPLGINGIIFGLVRVLVSSQRKFLMAQSYQVMWAGFLLTNSMVILSEWFLLSVLRGQILSLDGFTTSLFVSFLLFPILTIVLHFSHKFLPVSGTQSSLRMKV